LADRGIKLLPQDILKLEELRVAEPFEAAVLKAGPFPLAADLRGELQQWMLEWIHRWADKSSLQAAMWLQGSELHKGGVADLLVKHAAEWMPDLGLAIRPDGEPPRMMRPDDFNKRHWKDPITPKHETAVHLMNGGAAIDAAFATLFGSGGVIYCLLTGDASEYLAEQREIWLPRIVEPAFRAHPFYMPLLQARSVTEATPGALLRWMGKARLYLRESAEDEGVLIVSSIPGAMHEVRTIVHELAKRHSDAVVIDHR